MLLFLLACTEDPKDTGSSHTGQPADTGDSAADTGTGDTADTDTGDDTDTGSGLKDVRDEMIRNADACQIIGGHDDVPAAQQYYWGEFHGNDDDGWTGEEVWYLFGNQPWYDRGLEDCEVHFDITADPAGTGACTSCDAGLVAHAVVNVSNTTCPAPQYGGYETMEEPYAVERLGDGSIDWYFPGSGSQFAHGYWIEGAMNYLADDGCTLPVD